MLHEAGTCSLAKEFKTFTIEYGKAWLNAKHVELEKLQLLAARGLSHPEEMEAVHSAIDEIVAALEKAGAEEV